MDISKRRPPTGVVPGPPLHTQADNYRDGDPIVLFGQVTLSSGSSELVNAISLKNPTPHPIEIHEIRFNGHSVSLAMAAGIVGARFALPGDLGVSDNFIPWWLFDRSEQLHYGESVQENSSQIPDDISEADYVWRLHTPLLILPGEILTPNLQHNGLIAADIACTITYNGRVRVGMPIPSSRVIPFIAVWNAPSIDFAYLVSQYSAGGPNDFTVDSESPENALINSSDSVVVIRRLTGRLMTENQGNNNTIFSDEIQPIIDMLVNVQMQTSYGFQIVRDFTPVRLLFARDTRDYELYLPLQPGEYLLAQIQATANKYMKLVVKKPPRMW